jgi:hypothetical protein
LDHLWSRSEPEKGGGRGFNNDVAVETPVYAALPANVGRSTFDKRRIPTKLKGLLNDPLASLVGAKPAVLSQKALPDVAGKQKSSELDWNLQLSTSAVLSPKPGPRLCLQGERGFTATKAR